MQTEWTGEVGFVGSTLRLVLCCVCFACLFKLDPVHCIRVGVFCVFSLGCCEFGRQYWCSQLTVNYLERLISKMIKIVVNET